MPQRNGIGPMGRGPMTGRGRGACYGETTPDDRRGRPDGWGPGRGRGIGAGAGGGGRGWRHWFHATDVRGWMKERWGHPAIDDNEDSAEMERRALEHRTAQLESELGAIKEKLSELGHSSRTKEETTST